MPLWLLIPPVGALAVVVAARLRRRLRAAASDRAAELRRQRDAAARLRLTAARLEVATEVHDTVAHRLVDINTLAGVAAHLGAANRDNTLKDIKRISGACRPARDAECHAATRRRSRTSALTVGNWPGRE